ncbi:MAG TPA: SDR family oxidoreductase, partial [Miltoncostaeaceae bacterium]|nr:SDR family oxidoreductase [Miltoncostaeaceae bacterium]
MPTPAELFDMTGKIACVTGASAGLGVAFAETLSEAGATVVLAARRADALEEVAGRIRARGGTALVQPCDVTDEEQVNALVEAAVREYGRLDVMIANAGSIPEAAAVPEKIPAGLFRQSIDINLTGTYITAAAAGRQMLQQGSGSIILLASVGGMGGHYQIPVAYATSKAATIHLAKYLGMQWAQRGVRVNALGPGWFPSEMTEQVLGIPAWKQRIEDQTAMGRVGDPRELLGALLLLASDAGSYITGETIMVDGGMSASIGAHPYPEELVQMHAQFMPHGIGERVMP